MGECDATSSMEICLVGRLRRIGGARRSSGGAAGGGSRDASGGASRACQHGGHHRSYDNNDSGAYGSTGHGADDSNHSHGASHPVTGRLG